MELAISLPQQAHQRTIVLGPQNRHIKLIREALTVHIADRPDRLLLSGDDEHVGKAVHVIERLLHAAQQDQMPSQQQVLEWIASSKPGAQRNRQGQLTPDSLPVYLSGKSIRPATPNQRRYIEDIIRNDLVFCTGPAGCGKTYLAVAAATSMLKRGHVRKIILVRPAVEAGEKIGFLPGTLQEKVNPYLRPLLDALGDMMPFEQIQNFMEQNIIEIVPLAFMRGRTLNDACIILDEAQNTTKTQMLMFLTRLGQNSKMIVSGDIGQTDLDNIRNSGLLDAIKRLQRLNNIAIRALGKEGIVRHGLVQNILDAYDKNNEKLTFKNKPVSTQTS